MWGNKKQILKWFNYTAQFLIPALTLFAQFLLAYGYPKWSLVVNLVAQPFWLYSGWIALKKAKQSGILITSVIFTFITIWGVINYFAN